MSAKVSQSIMAGWVSGRMSATVAERQLYGNAGALPGISHRCFADTRWRQHTLGAQFLGDLSRFQAGHAHLKDALYLVTNVIKLSVLCIND